MKYMIACLGLFSLACFASQRNEYRFFVNNKTNDSIVIYYTDPNQFTEHKLLSAQTNESLGTNSTVDHIESYVPTIGKIRIPLSSIPLAPNFIRTLDVHPAVIYSANKKIIGLTTQGTYDNPLSFQS